MLPNIAFPYIFSDVHIIIMLKRLQLLSRSYFSFKQPTQAESPSGKVQYLVFATNYPVPPYYFYCTKVNTHLAQYLIQNKIKYVAAFAKRPAVYRDNFYPISQQQMEAKLGLAGHQWPDRGKNDTMDITYNNVMYDGPLQTNEESPVRVVTSPGQLYPVGTVCNINVQPKTNTVFLRSQIRLQGQNWGPPQSPAVMLVSGSYIKAQTLTAVTKQYQQLLQLYTRIKTITGLNLPDINVNQKAAIKVVQLLTGYLTTLSYFSQQTLYRVFETTNINAKIQLLLKCYKQYLNVLESHWKDFTDSQGDTLLRQKQAIQTVFDNTKRILGNPNQQKYIDKIKQKLKERNYPENIRKLIESQLSNMESQGTHDISRKKHYINLLTDYPFGVLVKEQYDIAKAKLILEQDHYGMTKLKQRILQFIAVSKLKGQFKSKVLLLYGPPGVGKTSIVKSIAKCLGRPYARVSLGGQYDTSIIKGHRKTYVGAYPGKIWDSIFRSKAQNPVILLDQIDKIMNRANGASLQDAVMQVLDPIQNYKFKDDFMDVQIDLSRVLFICTANTLDTIFPPLLDRLQRIQVNGYTTIQKMQIFKKYIIEQSKDNNGLTQQMRKQIDFKQQTAKALIQGYCKEAGVRNLVRKTNQIFQKIALKYVKNLPFEKQLLPSHLQEYIGLPVFHEGRLFQGAPPAGVMIGLAYNNYGGSIMYIQCANQGASSNTQSKSQVSNEAKSQVILTTPTSQEKEKEKPSSGSLLVTGNLHDVMKQSCQLALTYAKFITSTFFQSNYLQQNDLHLNFPQIEIGKDGPSAGIAITSALVSIALNKPMVKQYAMTGEISLSGRVGAIGGVKQKTMGAKRQGITTLIFPQDNRKDVEELQAEIRQGMNFHFVKHYFDVMQLVFGIKIQGKSKTSVQIDLNTTNNKVQGSHENEVRKAPAHTLVV